MQALEFEAIAKNGQIEIPATVADRVTGPVRVIVLYESEEGGASIFDAMMDAPAKILGFTPLSREEVHERAVVPPKRSLTQTCGSMRSLPTTS